MSVVDWCVWMPIGLVLWSFAIVVAACVSVAVAAIIYAAWKG